MQPRPSAPELPPASGEERALRASLPGRLALLARRFPDRVALRQKRLGLWEEHTFREYRDTVEATALALWELGVRRGDHVAILSDNRREWLFADLAAQALGARSVGIYQTNPAPEVAYVLRHAGCTVVFGEDQEQVDKLVAVRAETPATAHVVVFDPRGTRGYDDPRLVTWDAFLARGRALAGGHPGWLEERIHELDPRAPCMVVYTSGTTATPKGALITSENVTVQADAVIERLSVDERDLVLSYLPLCHVAEKIFTVYLPLTTGCIVHFGESIDTVQEDLREVSPTVFLGVPRIWEKMHAAVLLKMRDATRLKRGLFSLFFERLAGSTSRPLRWLAWLLVLRALHERLGLARCRYPISGAAPISAHVLRDFAALGIRILEGYGMTEVAGVSHVNPEDDVRLGSVGTVLSHLRCRIAADGEVLIHGPSVFAGYLHDEAATAEVVGVDGWLRTGDVGRLDADGYLVITGRKKEILITAGGKNISPEHVENALKTSPYIKEAVAIGDRRPHVAALVQLDFDATSDWATRRGIPHTSYADLGHKPEVVRLVAGEIERVNQLLARVEQVRAFRILPKQLHQDDGEVTATQKVRRKVVLARYAELVEALYAREVR